MRSGRVSGQDWLTDSQSGRAPVFKPALPATLGVKFSLNETESEREDGEWRGGLLGLLPCTGKNGRWSQAGCLYTGYCVLTATQPKLNWEQKSRSHQRGGEESHWHYSGVARSFWFLYLSWINDFPWIHSSNFLISSHTKLSCHFLSVFILPDLKTIAFWVFGPIYSRWYITL